MDNQNEEQKENKSFWQRARSRIVIISVVIAGFWLGGTIGVGVYRDNYVPYMREKNVEKMIKEYDKVMEEIHKYDNIGGDTPEETVDLFVEALKKGDMDLASKYFVAEEQEKARKKISIADKEKIIEELEYAKKIWKKEPHSNGNIEFWYNKEGAELSRDIVLSKVSNKWKISRINIYYLGF